MAVSITTANAAEKVRVRTAVYSSDVDKPKVDNVRWYRGTYRAYYGPNSVRTVYRTNAPLGMPLPMYGYGYPYGLPYYGWAYPGYTSYPYWGPYPYWSSYPYYYGGYPYYGNWAW